MPTFLDLLFTCGRQERHQDFHYTAFRHENYLYRDPNTADVSGLERFGRSGQRIQQCYSLHSAEPSRSIPDWGWSIRQTVVYHSFDVQTGKAAWIFIKGNNSIERRIMDATKSTRSVDMAARSHQTLTGSFGASLTVHNLIIEWCGENWRWYINEMEERLRNMAKFAVLADVDQLAGPDMISTPSRPGTLLIPRSARTTISKASPTSPSRLRGSFARFSTTSKTENSPTIGESGIPHPIHTENIVEEPQEIDIGGNNTNHKINLDHMFSFEKLQDLHQIGEYMQEALMVLKQNRNTIKEIREHYATLMGSREFPFGTKDDCQLSISRFNQRALSIEKDLEVQQSRLETLCVLLEDRSSLVSNQHYSRH